MSSNPDPPKPTSGTTDAEVPELSEGGTAKKKLTPEEQMALYEESLKEDDWGHQPC